MAKSTCEALVEAFEASSPSRTISPAPSFKRSSTREALRRCRAAWQRAFDAHMATHPCKKDDERWVTSDATEKAGIAYCNSLPVLCGYEGVRDFIACVAHGILIGAIPKDKTNQLLYAAQVAISTISHAPSLPKARPARAPLPPSPSKSRRK